MATLVPLSGVQIQLAYNIYENCILKQAQYKGV
jgi:hypothetical protein